MREWQETGRKKSPPGGYVVRIASGTGDCSQFAALALKLLNKIPAQAASAKPLGDLHVYIAVRPIVVKKDASFPGSVTLQLQNPLSATLSALDGILDFLPG